MGPSTRDELMAVTKAQFPNILADRLRKQYEKIFDEMRSDFWCYVPTQPRPWYKRIHPISRFREWLHRDCGDY